MHLSKKDLISSVSLTVWNILFLKALKLKRNRKQPKQKGEHQERVKRMKIQMKSISSFIKIPEKQRTEKRKNHIRKSFMCLSLCKQSLVGSKKTKDLSNRLGGSLLNKIWSSNGFKTKKSEKEHVTPLTTEECFQWLSLKMIFILVIQLCKSQSSHVSASL